MRILLAIDGSGPSDLATHAVATTRWPTGSTVRVASVVPRLGWSLDQNEASREHEPVWRAQTALETAERLLGGPGRRVETMLLDGRPASAIVDEATAFDADLIVVGSRGHGPWQSLVLGSVSAEIVDHAPCPVLVVRTVPLEPVVLCHDGSDHASRAETLLSLWPLLPGTEVTVVTVAQGAATYWPVAPNDASAVSMEAYAADAARGRSDAQDVADAAVARLGRAGIRAQAEVRVGEPAAEIVAAASDHRAGLIVLGTRGHSRIARLLLGSVARNVLMHAPCSVLVARPTRSRVGMREIRAASASEIV